MKQKLKKKSDCSHAVKRRSLKAMRNLDSRDITLLTKVCILKAAVFLVVTYVCESWTIKEAVHHRIDAFELCWRRLLRVPWTSRRLNQ